MFTGIILGLGIAAILLYVHKVGLPKVLAELKQGRIETVAAIGRHAAVNKANPIPIARTDTSGPDKVPTPTTQGTTT